MRVWCVREDLLHTNAQREFRLFTQSHAIKFRRSQHTHQDLRQFRQHVKLGQVDVGQSVDAAHVAQGRDVLSKKKEAKREIG